MNLEQMREIAAPLERELPELAGGAPTWPIYVPVSQIATPGIVAAKTSAQAKGTTNLFAVNQPTIMERWELMSIWFPAVGSVAFAAELTAAEINEIRWLLTANIRYGTDIIWSGSRGPQSLEPVKENIVANFVVAENFINPLPIERGRPLSLEIIENVWFPKATTTAVNISVSTAWNGTVGIPSEGTVQYVIQVLTGHRVL